MKPKIVDIAKAHARKCKKGKKAFEVYGFTPYISGIMSKAFQAEAGGTLERRIELLRVVKEIINLK